MALSVIGAGFGRTGTASLKIALEQLGFGPCHHMEEVLKHPAQLPYWQDAAARRAVDWEAAFAGYSSAVDWPSAHYWRELAAFYPAAKVILTRRPEEAWWNSFSQTIKVVIDQRATIPAPHVRACMEMGAEVVEGQTFGGSMDKVSALSAYHRRTEEVRAAIPAGRLLVFDVAQGWGPLCRFLGVAEPAGAFPRTNSVDAFWQAVRGGG